jgi:tetratricopeptide (TPR) repeat protein
MANKPTAIQQQFKSWLTQQPHEVLVAMLLEVAKRDDRLAQTLLVKSTPTSAQDSLVDDLRLVIDDVTTVDGFVDWRAMHSFSMPLDQAVDTLETLLTPEHAVALVELAQYAIERTEAALESVDDSNGLVGDILCRLGDLHLKACQLARPDAESLAHDLFQLETTLPFGVNSFSAQTYRNVLGKTGLLAYRALAQARWDALGLADVKVGFDHARYKITCIMEDLARASGDVDELVAIKSRDLTHASNYLSIAEILVNDKRHDEALQWAERGLKAHPDRTDNRLRDFLVAMYLQRKRLDEALQLTWIQFEEQPGLAAFQKLQGVADKLGIWPVQRARALAHLDEVVMREASQTSRYKPKPSAPDSSRRVAIALWESDLDAAWNAAQNGQCEQRLRLSLAQALEATKGREALSLYRQIIPEMVAQTNNDAYASAVVLVRKAGKLMGELGQGSQFLSYLAELRVSFKAKRNFIKLLDAVRVQAGVANTQAP